MKWEAREMASQPTSNHGGKRIPRTIIDGIDDTDVDRYGCRALDIDR